MVNHWLLRKSQRKEHTWFHDCVNAVRPSNIVWLSSCGNMEQENATNPSTRVCAKPLECSKGLLDRFFSSVSYGISIHLTKIYQEIKFSSKPNLFTRPISSIQKILLVVKHILVVAYKSRRKEISNTIICILSYILSLQFVYLHRFTLNSRHTLVEKTYSIPSMWTRCQIHCVSDPG